MLSEVLLGEMALGWRMVSSRRRTETMFGATAGLNLRAFRNTTHRDILILSCGYNAGTSRSR
jgi:hypothetical protein